MKIFVLPYHEFSKLMIDKGIDDQSISWLMHPDQFCICINDTYSKDQPFFKEDHENVLRLWFDDIDQNCTVPLIGEGIIHECLAMTDDQAMEIIRFLHKMKSENKKLCLAHCRAGIARSGAVGEFIADYFEVPYSEFKQSNPQTRPNPHVLATLKRVWRENDYQS